MAVDVDIDLALLKSEIKMTYASVSHNPDRTSSFRPGGRGQKTSVIRRSWRMSRRRPSSRSRGLRTRGNWPLGPVNAFSTWARVPGPIRSSQRRWSARTGRVTGIDMTPEMLAKARAAATEIGATNVEFVESEAEHLPFDDESFDIVISNGVIDLIPDKDGVFA